jgi:hypothetical protein
MHWEQSCFVWTDRRTDGCGDANSLFTYIFVRTQKVRLIYLRFNLFYLNVCLLMFKFVAFLLRNTDHSCLFSRGILPGIDMLSDPVSLFLYFKTVHWIYYFSLYLKRYTLANTSIMKFVLKTDTGQFFRESREKTRFW